MGGTGCLSIPVLQQVTASSVSTRHTKKASSKRRCYWPARVTQAPVCESWCRPGSWVSERRAGLAGGGSREPGVRRFLKLVGSYPESPANARERSLYIKPCVVPRHSQHTNVDPTLQIGTTVHPCCWTVSSVWALSWSTTQNTATGTASTEVWGRACLPACLPEP